MFAEGFDRRSFLLRSAAGLGGFALAEGALRSSEFARARASEASELDRSVPRRARAKRVIHLMMSGGVSQCDTFDYKPELIKRHGEEFDPGGSIEELSVARAKVMKSPWRFRPHGECGKYVSDLSPHLARRVDDVAFIHSMITESNIHAPAILNQTTGSISPGFARLGARVASALAGENENASAYVVLTDKPGSTLDSAFNRGESSAAGIRIQNRKRLNVLSHTSEYLIDNSWDDPSVLDLAGESAAVKALYGLDDRASEKFGRECLITRRLIERGARFVELRFGAASGRGGINWDSHEDIRTNYSITARRVDKPVAGLLIDLKALGLLDDTIVVWTTEFGRTPCDRRGERGRDHNANAFTCWLAGGGIKGGYSYGSSDPWSFRVVENPVTFGDLHATILHLLGLDADRLSYPRGGAEGRIVEAPGRVIQELFA
jgi:hypothetical protein